MESLSREPRTFFFTLIFGILSYFRLSGCDSYHKSVKETFFGYHPVSSDRSVCRFGYRSWATYVSCSKATASNMASYQISDLCHRPMKSNLLSWGQHQALEKLLRDKAQLLDLDQVLCSQGQYPMKRHHKVSWLEAKCSKYGLEWPSCGCGFNRPLSID